MTPLKVLRSGAFRLSLVFAGLFAAGGVVLFAAADAGVASYARRSLQTALHDEFSLLRSEAAVRGGEGLRLLIQRREQMPAGRHYFYLLADPEGRRLAGDLPAAAAKTGSGGLQLPESDDPGDQAEGETTHVQTLGARLPDGSLLVVGRDTDAYDDLREWMRHVTLWSAAGIFVLALGGGYLISHIFLDRLEGMNSAAQRIMAGRNFERLPRVGMGDEFDRLSQNLNKMLDRIDAAMSALRQVSTDIAHDLRTPLTRLRNHLEAARESRTTEEYEAATGEALAQVDQVLATFTALLRIGAVEGGAPRSRFAEVDLSEVMERVFQAYRPAAEDQKGALSADIAPGVRINGDAELLAQLFANLLENALAYAGPSPQVDMRLNADQEQAWASVGDRGPGVPPEERDQVLKPFYRLDASRAGGGAGLGLALVAAIAELHGAALHLSDNDPGLRVEIAFPLWQPPDLEPLS